MARLASLCAVLCAVVALIACAHAGASNVANGDLTSMSGFNLIAGYCFTSGGLLDWSIYTGGIPVSSPLSLYFFNEASWYVLRALSRHARRRSFSLSLSHSLIRPRSRARTTGKRPLPPTCRAPAVSRTRRPASWCRTTCPTTPRSPRAWLTLRWPTATSRTAGMFSTT